MSRQNLFNHLEICALLYAGNVSEALNVQKRIMTELLGSNDYNNYKVYLSALNHSIYNYILLKEKISLHQCCYDNHISIQNCTPANMLKAGKQIILAYGYCTEYLIERHGNEHIKKAIHYIHHHLSEPLSLDLLGNNININPSYLSDLFKRHVRCTFSKYVLMQRILLSKKLLKSTSLPVNIISERCGFKNTSYYCTCFRKMLGLSPCNYRNQEKADTCPGIEM